MSYSSLKGLPSRSRPSTVELADDVIALTNSPDVDRDALKDVESIKSERLVSQFAPTWFLLAAAIVMLASATFDTFSTKAMNKRFLPPCDGCKAAYFEAPMFQTFSGYIGEFFFLPIYFVDKWIAKWRKAPQYLDVVTSPEDLKKARCPIWVWIFPLLFDFLSTSCLNYASMLAQASTVTLLRNTSIILAFVLSALVLKNKIYTHQIIGALSVVVGLFLVAAHAMLQPDEHTNYNDIQWLGILTALAGALLSTLQWISEEYLFRRYYSSPFEGVGWMGFYGIIVGGIGVFVADAVGLEKFSHTLYQLRGDTHESRMVLGFSLSYIVSLAINTASGITVTKLASSLLRTIVNAGRTVSIWTMELILGWAGFHPLNFSGLVVILIAIVMYNYNYFTDSHNHWFGDQTLRRPATCLPNKYEVTLKKNYKDAQQTENLYSSSNIETPV